MFFTISKLAWFAINPLSLVVVTLAAGLGLHLVGRQRAGWRVVASVVVLLTLFMVFPVDDWVTYPLEQRFAAFVDPPARVDGIVVLGGSQETRVTTARGRPALNGSGERMTAMLSLARRYPDARIIFSGANGNLLDPTAREADTVRLLAAEFSLQPGRIEYEEQSRNTYENAAYSKALANPRPAETWLLVTSARHMPRAVGCFRSVGFAVTPLSVDFLTGRPDWVRHVIDPTEQFDRLSQGLREWMGLAVYRLTGRTSSFLPGPEG